MAAATASSSAFPRIDDRNVLSASGTVFALASAGAAMSGAAADAMFLAELGPEHLGEAVAISSALLAVVLAVVGGLADRLDRRKILGTLAMGSAVVIAAMAALSIVAPRAAAAVTMIGAKQLSAATDLAFWVVIAERLDARRSKKLLPVLAASGGIGAAAGAVLVVPVAAAVGARGVLVCAAVLLVLAALGSARLPSTRRVAQPSAPVGALIARSWRDGARAVRQNALARRLAALVACAGVFASLAYFALGVALVGAQADAADLAAWLGGVRAGAQALTLVVQLAIAPRILGAVGTGHALLIAPAVALAAALGLVVAPILAVAIATQISARVSDAGIETPAEKLAQTLLPTAIRGRVGGFLDGPAKRAGAALGGLVAASFAGAPAWFYGAMAVAAGAWLVVAAQLARELPTLAIEHVLDRPDPGRRDELDAFVDPRARSVLVGELAGARPERAAEVLSRLHEAGRFDAVDPLAHAACQRGGTTVWRSLGAVLDAPAVRHGPALVVAARRCEGDELELAVRVLGLAGGVTAAELAAWRAATDAALALTAEVATLRLAGDTAGLLAVLAESVRDAGPTGRVATDELAVEISRALAARDDDRVLEAARHLTRALRRGRGDIASRTHAFATLARVVEAAERGTVVTSGGPRSAELVLLRADLLDLARERIETGATPIAPEHMLTSLVRVSARPTDDAGEVAVALRLYGALLESADTVDADDLRRMARALGEPDDEVRAAAEAAFVALGPIAAGELVATAAWGRRRARDRAAALLAELPVTPATIDRLIDAELDALDGTHAAIAALSDPGDALLVRRLEERLREIAHTVLLLVAARHRSPAITRAARAWGHARGGQERARTLAVIEAALPRALIGRLVEAVDDLAPAERARLLAATDVAIPTRDAVMRSELAGRDRLARALALHAMGAAGRSAHRDTIARAAHDEAAAASPADLLRKLVTGPIRQPEEETDMPSRVETLIALGKVPLLASLSTRQLADVAERARWVAVREGSVVVTSGDAIDALLVVDDGELATGPRRIGKGEVVDELAPFAPSTLVDDLRATRPTRLIRLERVDFEELVDDVPGLAAAVCRALGERARRAEDAHYRSPLASRA